MKEKQVWNILHLTTGVYMYILDHDSNIYTQNFKNKSEAYWKLIGAINNYNGNLAYYTKVKSERAEHLSNYKPIFYSEFEILTTKPLGK
jgi:hypothetical protein